MEAAAERVGQGGQASGVVSQARAPGALGLGPGFPLPAPERSYFERRLGADLSSVRVHPESAAATDLGAQAFAAGREAPLSWDFSKIPVHPPGSAERRQNLPLFPGPRLLIQAKLKIGSTDDPLEHEADRVAEQVMRMPAPASRLSSAPPHVSRKCAACGEEDGRLQKKESAPALPALSEAPPSVHEVLRSPGEPLDAATRAYFEPRFGRDFNRVRIHADTRAAESVRSVEARAYTIGQHVVFGRDQYAPYTADGRHLLSHELAHTLQQSDGLNHSIRGAPSRDLMSASLSLQRQAGTAPDPGKFNDCKDLLDRIKEAFYMLAQRAFDLLNDPLGLQWDNWLTPKTLPDGTNLGSVIGHQQQYEGWRNRLRRLIQEWDNDDCNSTGLRIDQGIRDLVFKPTPAPLPRPRPETGPNPWTPPGTAAIIGAALGAVVGAVAGTFAEPGGGTVAGEVAGEEAGSWVGAWLSQVL